MAGASNDEHSACTVGPPGKVNVVDDQELRDLAGHIRDNWKDVASSLKLSKNVIFNVEEDNKGRHKEIVVQMLFRWKQQQGKNATYAVLVAALKKEKMDELLTPPTCQEIFKSCAPKQEQEKQ